ncbi:glycerophosphodiester phosphodiesterase [Terriglobus albidus]|uniref:Glycerophosphodiester phosphodiesterase n=1 Tax=Terriglobus albidus TaxID=1592106 RepID=A0A5B9EGS6_9BACT|nr:glycerophosphodiester phosphodiesterase family protein [Terriglobus albidus]QEE30345.1 glycerophosphodiester phosphodiesterase [Terriglobus albidus]
MRRRILWFGLVGLCISIWVCNSSLFSHPFAQRPVWLAHRGVHQDYTHTGLTDESCTARFIYPPKTSYIEDTLPAIGEAFRDGADFVDFDVHPTNDGHWVVFHDWRLECRTNGHGVTRQQSLQYLQTLDVGYGYTADGGATFPLRGKGVELMPSLENVLQGFPDRSFIVHIKSNDPNDGKELARTLRNLSGNQISRLSVTGGDRPIRALRENLPSVRSMSPSSIKNCLKTYALLGEFGYVPTACRNTVLFVPTNVGPWLWGWPDRFLGRMEKVNTLVFAVDDLQSGGTKGLNDAKDLAKLPRNYTGGIWTDRIESIHDPKH